MYLCANVSLNQCFLSYLHKRDNDCSRTFLNWSGVFAHNYSHVFQFAMVYRLANFILLVSMVCFGHFLLYREYLRLLVSMILLTRERELGARRYLYQSLAQLAGPVAAQGNPEKAAQLPGASEALLESMGSGSQAGDSRDIERYVARAREQLDATTFECDWAKGRAISLEEALALALG